MCWPGGCEGKVLAVDGSSHNMEVIQKSVSHFSVGFYNNNNRYQNFQYPPVSYIWREKMKLIYGKLRSRFQV